MATDSGIDPRYAAQFQRGFDPARHSAEPVRERRGPLPIQNLQTPVVRRVPDPPRIVERPGVAPPAVAATEQPEPPAEWPPARPRAERALLAVGVGLVVVAAALFWGSIDLARRYQGTGSRFEDQLWALAVNTLPGPFLVAGVVALCLWIVLRAVRLPRVTP